MLGLLLLLGACGGDDPPGQPPAASPEPTQTPLEDTPIPSSIPLLITSRETVDFGGVELATLASTEVVVHNQTEGPLEVSVQISSWASVFGIDPPARTAIDAASDHTFTLTFAPQETNVDYAGTLELSVTGAGLQASLPIRGFGLTSGDVDNDGDGITENAGDCNDQDGTVFPAAAELCDGLDNDCDGQTDESVPTWYVDNDGDGYGQTLTGVTGCEGAEGTTPYGGDCNDDADDVFPNQTESCDGRDEDCDGMVDDGLETFPQYADLDQDGFGTDSLVQVCAGHPGASPETGDCDDGDATVYPGATERCDGQDSDCDGQVDEEGATLYYVDADGDGFGSPDSPTEGCDPTGMAEVGEDCDDGAPESYPGADELCDGQDNDCDQLIDEEVQRLYHQDTDGDGYGSDQVNTLACTAPQGYIAQAGDCDDGDPGINPEALETCNQIDDNCDGVVDEGLELPFYPDEDGDGYGLSLQTPTYACEAPEDQAPLDGDCDDTDPVVHPDAEELCNEQDDDCDGIIDDGAATTFYLDLDQDGYGGDTVLEACTQPEGYSALGGDCNDQDALVHFGAEEICDGVDNDCDALVDEEGVSTYHRDYDLDGYGDPIFTQASCTRLEGWVSNAEDCDDLDPAVHPGAEERCNGLDDDCNGQIDEAVSNRYYLDGDGDSFGRDESVVEGCSRPSEAYLDRGGDCNDLDPAVFPGAVEVCNAVDDNCDGQVDEGATTPFFADADQDGAGDGEVSLEACATPEGYVNSNGDCNDAAAAIYPGAEEVCDGLDNNCDGVIDEDLQATYYLDLDADGYGQTLATLEDCALPEGYASQGEDCNDNASNIYPGAEEACDNRDNNCDGAIDEAVKTLYYYDADADGYGDSSSEVAACAVPSLQYVEVGGDCDDLNAYIHPDAQELCNGLDDNCDGTTDDLDLDQDGYVAQACGGEDCDEYDPFTNPLGTEICDGVDNNCDGIVDETDPDIDFDTDPDNCGGCEVACGLDGLGPTCQDGRCAALPTWQALWRDVTTIDATSGWVTLAGSALEITTAGGPLELDLDLPIRGDGDATCRPTLDGDWVGALAGLPEDFAYHEGKESVGFGGLELRRKWRRTRVYEEIPAGPHSLAVECRTDSGTLEVGREGASAVLIAREYLGKNLIHQQVALTGNSTSSSTRFVKLEDSDLTVTTTQSTLEVTVSLPIGGGGNAGCLEFMDGEVPPSDPSYSDARWYGGLEATQGAWVMWHRTRLYADIPPGTHTFSIRCNNDANTLQIGGQDMASVIIVRELEDAYYTVAQATDTYANGWEIEAGLDGRWYDLEHLSLELAVQRGAVAMSATLDFYNVAAGQYLACRSMIDGVWAGTLGGGTFGSNEEEGSVKEYVDGSAGQGMWRQMRVYTGISPGVHVFSYQCTSSGDGYNVGYNGHSHLLVREVDWEGGG